MAEQNRNEFKENSYFINYYFNSLNRRLYANKRPLIRDYLIIVLYYIQCLKHFMILFIEFDYEIRLIQFDLSLFIGGIEKYNTIICILGCLLGAYLHKLLYLVSPKDLIWIKLLYSSKEEIPQNVDIREKLIYNKVFSMSRILYKILDLAIVSWGKFFAKLIFNFPLKFLTKIIFSVSFRNSYFTLSSSS
jgi:hypothetical protein